MLYVYILKRVINMKSYASAVHTLSCSPLHSMSICTSDLKFSSAATSEFLSSFSVYLI